MKTDMQWIKEFGGSPTVLASVRSQEIKAVQVDALRHAADLCRKHDGLSILAADRIEESAAELDTSHENPPPVV